MSNIFPLIYGPTGRSVVVDSEGKIVAITEDGSAAYPLGYGDTGRPLVVDASGRLIFSPLSNIVPSSGTALPDAASYEFGRHFYVVGSGFYRRGISAWEKETTA